MNNFEWFLLVVVVIAVPLVVAIVVTLWTLEMARLRNRKNREGDGAAAVGVKRKATRSADDAVSESNVGSAAPAAVVAPALVSTATSSDGASKEVSPVDPFVTQESCGIGGGAVTKDYSIDEETPASDSSSDDAGSSSSNSSNDGGSSSSS